MIRRRADVARTYSLTMAWSSDARRLSRSEIVPGDHRDSWMTARTAAFQSLVATDVDDLMLWGHTERSRLRRPEVALLRRPRQAAQAAAWSYRCPGRNSVYNI
jgi:hypothetical protein